MKDHLKGVDAQDLMRGIVTAITQAVDRGAIHTDDAQRIKNDIEREALEHAAGRGAPQTPLTSLNCVSSKETEMNMVDSFSAGFLGEGISKEQANRILEKASDHYLDIKTGKYVVPDSIRALYGLEPSVVKSNG